MDFKLNEELKSERVGSFFLKVLSRLVLFVCFVLCVCLFVRSLVDFRGKKAESLSAAAEKITCHEVVSLPEAFSLRPILTASLR